MAIIIRSRGAQRLQNRYRESIERVINTIRATDTGKIVIKHLEHSRRRVIISPYLDTDNNATATPGNELSGGTFSAGRIARGTGSRIAFSVNRSTMPGRVQGRADEVLLHEMAHALRQTTGTERLVRLPDNRIGLLRIASFENVEEFFAAMVASVHSSELGRAILGNHGTWALRNPEVLNEQPYSTRIRQICERMPEFANNMAIIPERMAAFNPFRDEMARNRRN